MRTRSATALHHRALVGLREVDLAGLGVVAEALHVHELALALEPFLPDHRADEDQHDRDAQEGADGQEYGDGDGDLHGGGSLRGGAYGAGLRLAFAVAALDVLAGLEVLEALVAGALGHRDVGRIAREALVVGRALVDVAAD